MSKKKEDPWVALLAGSISGGIECCATWPSEYAKTALQLQPKVNPKYTSFLNCLTKTVSEHGILGVYRGLSVTLALSIPKAGIRFGAFETFKNAISGEAKASPGQNLAAGMGAGIAEAVLIVTPLETLKVKLMERQMGMVSGIKYIIQTEGISGVYRGLSATCVKQASNQGIRFFSFNIYKDALLASSKQKDLGPMEALLGGMIAGSISTLANNPVDVVKTRLQGVEAKQYSSTFDCAKKILTNEGPMAFYKGTVPRLARVVPGQGIIFMSYEGISRWIDGLINGPKQ